jgi:hypothetical protein
MNEKTTKSTDIILLSRITSDFQLLKEAFWLEFQRKEISYSQNFRE